MSIKDELIHWLGGIPLSQYDRELSKERRAGKLEALVDVRELMHSLNGMDGDTWATNAYTYVQKKIEQERSK